MKRINLEFKKWVFIVISICLVLSLSFLMYYNYLNKLQIGAYDGRTLGLFANSLEMIVDSYNSDSKSEIQINTELDEFRVLLGYMRCSPIMNGIPRGFNEIWNFSASDLDEDMIEKIAKIAALFQDIEDKLLNQEGNYSILVYKYFRNSNNIIKITNDVKDILNQ